MNLRFVAIAAMALSLAGVRAEAPADYYKNCEGKTGKDLLTALYNTISAHTTVSYDGLWTVYKTSDVRPDGTVWDMYSTKHWVEGQERCGNYTVVGSCINREHSMPKSWFNDASPMYSDAYHLYPTDGKVNGQRSNFPYGECSGGTTLPSSNGVQALGRLGTSTFPGYSGKVFEPADEYKGDLARSYFYMATAYNNRISTWNSDMLANNNFPAFSNWALNLLLKWHRMDPVSEKELVRNDAVSEYQKNRNPFIDCPELVEYIWGDKQGQAWRQGIGSEPSILLPADGSDIDLGTAAVGITRNTKVKVRGQSLKNNVSIAVSGKGFSVTPATLSASAVNNIDGTEITVSYLSDTAGPADGTLTVSADGLRCTANLHVTAMTGLPATPASDISDCSFVAHWTYVGMEDSNGCYRLTVTDENGEAVDTYPRSVPARDEYYLVDELEPSTHYRYSISCSSLTSNTMDVTTADPIPSIQFLYDGDLDIVSAPYVASEAYEILMDAVNIDCPINLSVSEPFALSTDKSTWTQSITLQPIEDRFYLRVNACAAGTYTSTLRAVAGDFENDDTEITANISADPTFFEDFEANQTGNYTTASVNGTASTWALSDAGVYNVTKEAHEGSNYVRMGNSNSSTLTMTQDRPRGIGIVTMYIAGWSASDGSFEFDLQTSDDQGATWTTAEHRKFEAPSSSNKEYTQYSFTVNRPGTQRLRIAQTYGKRFCIDDIAATDYIAGIDDITLDSRCWDAFCRNGELAIELKKAARVVVFDVRGIIYNNKQLSAGETFFKLPAGLYLVSVGDTVRRVLVK